MDKQVHLGRQAEITGTVTMRPIRVRKADEVRTERIRLMEDVPTWAEYLTQARQSLPD